MHACAMKFPGYGPSLVFGTPLKQSRSRPRRVSTRSVGPSTRTLDCSESNLPRFCCPYWSLTRTLFFTMQSRHRPQPPPSIFCYITRVLYLSRSSYMRFKLQMSPGIPGTGDHFSKAVLRSVSVAAVWLPHTMPSWFGIQVSASHVMSISEYASHAALFRFSAAIQPD
jgi:hypothetical protein